MKLNLHTHSCYSDGCGTIRGYADMAKKHNHVCLVLSDHDYMMSVKKFKEELEEAELMSQEEGIAIICGLEISLWYEEALLFGKEACLDWLERRASFVEGNMSAGVTRFDYLAKYIKEIKEKYECALVLCHPSLHEEYSKPLFDNGIIDLFDGYEIQNSFRRWPQDKIKWMETIMPHAKQYKNYDSHNKDRFIGETNETEEYIGNDKELIAWIRVK